MNARRIADEFVKGGLYLSSNRNLATLTGCTGVVQKGFPMRKRTTVTIKIHVDVAGCLYGIAAILCVIF